MVLLGVAGFVSLDKSMVFLGTWVENLWIRWDWFWVFRLRMDMGMGFDASLRPLRLLTIRPIYDERYSTSRPLLRWNLFFELATIR